MTVRAVVRQPTVAINDIMGLRDVAKLAGVQDSAVANWRTRYRGTVRAFPVPMTYVSDGTPLWRRQDVTAWLNRWKGVTP